MSDQSDTADTAGTAEVDDAVFRAAERYQNDGWAVFPVNGKVPATRNGVKDASTAPRKAAIWWARYPERGVALATGQPSGAWALDLDGKVGTDAFVALQGEHGRVPETVASRTGGGGYHLLWRMPEDGDVRNSASQVAEKVDVRGTGGYIVLPPSLHPSGDRYEWLAGRSPDECTVKAAPDWLIEMVRAPTVSAADGKRVTVPDTIPEGGGPFGGRDEALFRIGCSLRAKGLSHSAIEAALLVENRDRCLPPLDEATVIRKAEQASKYEPGTSAPLSTFAQNRHTNGANGNHGDPAGNGVDPAAEPDAPLVEVVDLDVLRDIAVEKQKPVDAVETPWKSWNRACYGAGGGRGLARKWHVVLGAASGSGKSLAAMNLTASALRSGHDVCLVSLEMSRSENVTRLLAILTGQPVRALEHGSFDPAMWEAATERMLEQPGQLWTNPGKINQLTQVERVLYEQAEKGVRLVIVDYLQLAWIRGADTLYQQITEVSHVIQGLAKQLDITTIGVSQVNRRTSTGDSKLRKEGLMGGSSLENDAEQVVLIGAPERQMSSFVSEVRLDKNRHGPQADWKIALDSATLTMNQISA